METDFRLCTRKDLSLLHMYANFNLSQLTTNGANHAWKRKNSAKLIHALINRSITLYFISSVEKWQTTGFQFL